MCVCVCVWRVHIQSCCNILFMILSTPLGPVMVVVVVAVVVSMCLACLVWIQLAHSAAILISHSESMRV